MKRVARLLCACVLLLLATGCAQLPPLRVDLPELKMMPPEVALKLAKRHIPSADSYGFVGNKGGMCSSESYVWIPYSDLARAVYAEKKYLLTVYSGDFCDRRIQLPHLTPGEAAELAAAMNALGAKIVAVMVL